jgi:hypothetical protein
MQHPIVAVEIYRSTMNGRLSVIFHRKNNFSPTPRFITQARLSFFTRLLNTAFTFCTPAEAVLYPDDIVIIVDATELRRRCKNPDACNRPANLAQTPSRRRR